MSTTWGNNRGMADVQDNQQPWQIAESQYPRSGTLEEQLQFLVGYAILAPSVRNSQPWQFRIVHDTVELRADPSQALPVADPRGRQRTISCGAALYYLRLAVRYFGHQAEVDIFPQTVETNLLARVRVVGTAAPDELTQSLFRAIRHRVTWRGAFRERIIPRPILDTLQQAAGEEEGTLFILNTREKEVAAALIANSDAQLRANADYVEEVVAAEKDWGGYAPEETSDSRFQALINRLKRLFYAWLPSQWAARRDLRMVAEAPILAVLATLEDNPEDWLQTGQALARVLLQADLSGIQASFFSQPTEQLYQRARFQKLLDDGIPQVVFRLGYGAAGRPAHTRRRAVGEVASVHRHAG